MSKNAVRVAFGSGTKRFDKKGLHPNLGLSCWENDIAPGHYQTLEEWGKKEIPGLKWSKKEKGEVMRKLKFKVNESNKIRTPNVTQVQPVIEEKDNANTPKRSGTSTTKRFQEPKSITPGPGFYGKNHIPGLSQEEWSKSQKKTGEWGLSEQPRFPEYLVAPQWKMTPAQYNVKNPYSMQAVIDKKTSKKGPYQLFTGKRDETSLTGYFAAPKFKGSATTFYELPSEMKRLEAPSKYHIGRWHPLLTSMQTGGLRQSGFNKKPTQRHLIGNLAFAYHDPNEPGPADYHPKSGLSIEYGYNPPFSSRAKLTREKIEYIKCNPGATRYCPKDIYYVNGHQNIFKSKVPRLRK